MAGAAQLKRGVVVAAALLLVACVPFQRPSTAVPHTYTVQAGDTLYSISFRHGLDWRDVARWNGIEPPRYLIRPGQRIRLWPPAGGTAATGSEPGRPRPTQQPTQAPRPTPAPERSPTITVENRVRFIWPTEGEVVAGFDDPQGTGKGIAIAGRNGQAVVAAAPGRVVYTGSGLVGYGALIIVKHNNQLLSAYAHNREILVAEGDDVSAGQRIATMGEGPGRRAMLHFEIRVDGRAVDPMPHLPAR